METKVCKHCGRELPVENFAKNAGTPDGYQRWCRECCSEYNRERTRQKRENAFSFNQKSPDPNSELAKFTPRQLMTELYARGYKGTLTYTKVIDITKL